MVIELDERKIFTGSTNHSSHGQNLCDTAKMTQMLTRDLFTIANVLVCIIVK